MDGMKTRTADTPSFEELTTPQPESTDPDYLAWRDAKVRAALKAKEDGAATYKSLEEIAAKYGLDVR